MLAAAGSAICYHRHAGDSSAPIWQPWQLLPPAAQLLRAAGGRGCALSWCGADNLAPCTHSTRASSSAVCAGREGLCRTPASYLSLPLPVSNPTFLSQRAAGELVCRNGRTSALLRRAFSFILQTTQTPVPSTAVLERFAASWMRFRRGPGAGAGQHPLGTAAAPGQRDGLGPNSALPAGSAQNKGSV